MRAGALRCAAVGVCLALACAGITLASAGPAQADSATAYLDGFYVSTARPTLTVEVAPSVPFGDYALTWYIEKDGYPVADHTGSDSGTLGTTTTYRTDPFVVDTSDLADGDYYLVGSITVTYPDQPDRTDTFVEPFHADFTGPTVTSIKLSSPVVYPRVSQYYANIVGLPSYVTISTTGGDWTDVSGYAVVKAGTTYADIWASSRVADWDGRTDRTPVPAGSYTLVPHDSYGNPATTTTGIEVSGKRLVRRGWTRTVTPRASLVDRYVGRCSTLKRPARAGWAGSFGYYSNTRCSTRSARKTSVSTLHRLRLPAVALPIGVRVDTVGGGARSKRRSSAHIRYLQTNGRWGAERRLNGALGKHAGPTAGQQLKAYLFKNRVFSWNVVAGYGSRYDVRSFTVTFSYFSLE